jgi:NAD(P)-dependent dehydrogenase (short-subunit alcohol dehydrogenase family)
MIDDVLDVNVKGTIMACKSMAMWMRGLDKEGIHSPCIINIASLLGVKGGYGSTVYAASKAAVLGFTRALSLEYGRLGIRVNAIVPGFVETDITKGTLSIFEPASFKVHLVLIHVRVWLMVPHPKGVSLLTLTALQTSRGTSVKTPSGRYR